jgi:P4 family phage/plasmid primase-like protien
MKRSIHVEQTAYVNIHAKSLNTSKTTMNFSTFMQKHKINKGDDKPSTNTRIGDGASIYSGNYHIPEEEYADFLRIYNEEIVLKNKPEYLTETQLKTDGPILVDLDLRFEYSCETRKYTKDHTDDLVNEYLDQLKLIYQFNENTRFSIFVLEKPNINRVEKKQITKDGLHLIIGIKSERKMQILLRKRMLPKLEEMWGGENGLGIINTFDEVLDEGISTGGTNWQLYGSGKPNHERYRLTYVYNITGYDTADQQFTSDVVDVSRTPVPMKEYIHQLSARNSKHPTFFYTTSFANELHSVPDAPIRRANVSTRTTLSVDVMNIRNATDLEMATKSFLESIQESEFELRETWEYTMVLPTMYYEEGSYSKWIRVGWALRNIDNRLFILWVAFSAKASRFDYTTIPELYEKWLKFDISNPGETHRGLTKRSIMHWAKEDAREDFVRIRESSIDLAIERSLGSYELLEDGKADKRGCADTDIATILHQLYKSEYVCSGITSNTWYKYEEPRWRRIDAGVYLRKHISNELRSIYAKKASYYMELRSRLSEGQDAHRIKQVSSHIDKIMSIYTRLGNTNDKKNIMTEAKELFYNDRFEEKLDANAYLICFKNGVVDFKEKVFRRGYPEDHITKCTGIDYIPDVYSGHHKPTIDKLTDFMQKLFPNPELCTYMWEHLASSLIGIHPNQTWNIYIGEGQNGKSVLVKLMEYVLGEYKGIVPLSLLTDRRTKIGGTSPEVIGLQGLRYAVMQEPTKGDRVNEGVMKQLVSGIDPIQARGLYMQNAITFYPQFKLILCTNNLMDIKSNDHGTWRRIRVVPFKSLFTENPVDNDLEKPYQYMIDRTLEERIRDWKEVFASMLVLKTFETNGEVRDCSIVIEARDMYRKDQDAIAEYLADNIYSEPNSTISKSDLSASLNLWRTTNNYGKEPSIKEITAQMDKKYKKCMKTKGWIGCDFIANKEHKQQTDIDDDDVFDGQEEEEV